MSATANQLDHSLIITPYKGTFLGFTAILMWGMLPLLRLYASALPPLQLAWISFFIAAAVTWLLHGFQGQKESLLQAVYKDGKALWAASFLLGAVAFYFAALTQAPAAEVTLVTYMWPLGLSIAVHISACRLPGLQMCTGLLLAFAGAALALLTGNEGKSLQGLSLGLFAGYALGLSSGLCWLGYSLMLRRIPQSFGLQAQIFALAGIKAGILHFLLETTATTVSTAGLLSALSIGIGPYGLAFICWGYGLCFGQTKILSALCYSVPIIATLLLILAGIEEWRSELAIAALAVACGAWLAGNGQ
jgi:drug/metabolite transporter (DMT)-like permease